MLSVSLSPNVIKLTGFYRKSKIDKIVLAKVLPKFGKSCANVQALFETQTTSDRISQQQKKLMSSTLNFSTFLIFLCKKKLLRIQ
jgi:hypothetical protein